jgi:ABC-2 type transport system ATP-binding protein
VECLAGLRKPTAGATAIFGQNPQAHRKEIYKHFGIQLQESAYTEKIRVEEICAWFASFYDNPASYTKLLTQLGLADKKKDKVGKLSGGQKQRLSILLAILPRPKMLILDELTTGLDPEARRSIWEILKVIKQDGVGILLVSHFMDEVEYLADRIIFMQGGKTLYSGTLAGLKTFAEENLPPDRWQPDMTLEEIYLAFAPTQPIATLEGLS